MVLITPNNIYMIPGRISLITFIVFDNVMATASEKIRQWEAKEINHFSCFVCNSICSMTSRKRWVSVNDHWESFDVLYRLSIAPRIWKRIWASGTYGRGQWRSHRDDTSRESEPDHHHHSPGAGADHHLHGGGRSDDIPPIEKQSFWFR